MLGARSVETWLKFPSATVRTIMQTDAMQTPTHTNTRRDG